MRVCFFVGLVADENDDCVTWLQVGRKHGGQIGLQLRKKPLRCIIHARWHVVRIFIINVQPSVGANVFPSDGEGQIYLTSERQYSRSNLRRRGASNSIELPMDPFGAVAPS